MVEPVGVVGLDGVSGVVEPVEVVGVVETFVNQCKNDSRSSVELKIKIGRVFCMPYTANIFCSCWFNFLANLYSCQVLVLYLSAVFQKTL